MQKTNGDPEEISLCQKAGKRGLPYSHQHSSTFEPSLSKKVCSKRPTDCYKTFLIKHKGQIPALGHTDFIRLGGNISRG